LLHGCLGTPVISVLFPALPRGILGYFAPDGSRVLLVSAYVPILKAVPTFYFISRLFFLSSLLLFDSCTGFEPFLDLVAKESHFRGIAWDFLTVKSQACSYADATVVFWGKIELFMKSFNCQYLPASNLSMN
jgi:hypothetical protein